MGGFGFGKVIFTNYRYQYYYGDVIASNNVYALLC